MIVADTNLIAGLYTDSIQRERILSVYKKDPVWAAPYLWRSEMRNVMALYMRKQLLKQDQVVQIMQWAEDQMGLNEYLPLSGHVLSLAAVSGCTAYDCEFVSIANALACPLVTFDKQVLERFPDIAVSPEGFVSK